MGCGWLGLPLALALAAKGHSIKGSTTSEDKLAELRSKKIQPYLIRLAENGITGYIDEFLSEADILIINVPPKLRGNQSENYVKKMQLLHKHVLKSKVRQVIFVSSTSVYGRNQGEVTEASTPEPATESGRQLLASEAIFRNSKNLQTNIIRFGGLISDDRHPIQMLAGRKNLANGHHAVNLIHRLDCIRIIEYLIEKAMWDHTLNGVYPYHPTKKEYYTAEAKKRNLQLPEYEDSNTDLGKKVTPMVLLNVKEFCFNTSISS